MNRLPEILGQLKRVRQSKDRQWQACCPAHEDQNPSLTISLDDNGRILMHCHANCSIESICEALGIEKKDLFLSPKSSQKSARKLVAAYDYRDEQGVLQFQVCRYEPKGFAQRRPDGNGDWIWNLNGTKRILYHKASILTAPADEWIFVAEGEKDADRLASIGLHATTNPGGAGKWYTLTDSKILHQKKIAILSDNDDSGKDHADAIAMNLLGKAESIRIVELPDLGLKQDVSDWLDDGGAREELLTLVEKADEYHPEKVPSKSTAAPSQNALSFQPFPVEAFPEPVRSFILQASYAIGCDPSYVALPLLSIVAATIGNTRRIQVKEGWTEPCVIWTAIIGESGTMKTPAVECPMKPLIDKQNDAMKEFDERKKQYSRDQLVYKEELKNWKKDGKNNGMEPPEPPEEPICQRLWCSDITVEALADRLSSAPKGLLIFRDELSGWLSSFNQYKGGKGGDSSHWLSMHGAKPLMVDRKTGDKTTIYIPRAAVSITGGIQPGILRRVFGQEHFENGMAARILLAMPPRKPKTWNNGVISPELQRRWAELFDCFFDLDFMTINGTDPQPIDIALTPKAQEVFINFFNEHNAEAINYTGDDAAAWSKLEGYAARLALVFHYIRYAARDEELVSDNVIDEKSIRAAVKLVKWFRYETKRVYQVLGETEQEHEIRQIVEKIIAKGGSVSVRDWQRTCHHPSTNEAKEDLEKLIDLSLGCWTNHPSGDKGGRPKQIFQLNTSVTSDKTPSQSLQNGVLSLSHPKENLSDHSDDEYEQRERSAILEFDGGLPSAEAEAQALREITERVDKIKGKTD